VLLVLQCNFEYLSAIHKQFIPRTVKSLGNWTWMSEDSEDCRCMTASYLLGLWLQNCILECVSICYLFKLLPLFKIKTLYIPWASSRSNISCFNGIPYHEYERKIGSTSKMEDTVNVCVPSSNKIRNYLQTYTFISLQITVMIVISSQQLVTIIIVLV
jgi:hypothetical protein